MPIIKTILEYLRLFRFHAVSMETTIILIGALVMGQREIPLLLVIFLIGLFGHITGYVLNDYADLEVDKKSDELKEKPLVSGLISKKTAILIAVISAIITYSLTLYFFPYVQTLLLLGLATLLTIIYDFYGKKIPGSDFIVAGTITVFCLYGASTVGLPFNNIIYLVCLTFFFDVVFINVVEGGLKDVDHDYLSGARTFATVAGVKVKEGKLFITKKFIVFSYLIRALYFLTVIYLGLQTELNIWKGDNYLLLILVIIFMILVLLGSAKLLNMKEFDRGKMKKTYGGLNAASGILYLLVLSPIFGLVITLFLVLYPFLWYTIFNTLLFGKPMQPRV